jgi:hypothetical protein
MSRRELGPPSALLDVLARLHRHKDAAYGDSWRRRGEVIAIFANLARKYDRLVLGLAEEQQVSTESLPDTVADLCVYAAKYLTWLAETQPQAFHGHVPNLEAADASARRGTEALDAVFAALPDWEESTRTAPPADSTAAWTRVRDAFRGLERGLMAQAETGVGSDEVIPWSRKVELAWMLTDGSAWLLARLVERDPFFLDRLHGELAVMDSRAAS